MLQQILNLYYLTILAALVLFFIHLEVSKNKLDPIDTLKELNDGLSEMGNEQVKDWILRYMDVAMENRILGFISIFLLALCPILNLLLISASVKGIIESL